MIKLRKFIVALSEKDAANIAVIWSTQPEAQGSLATNVFDGREAADRARADLIQRAKDDSPFGCDVPCDKHSRCFGFDPKVWEVRLSVGLGENKIEEKNA